MGTILFDSEGHGRITGSSLPKSGRVGKDRTVAVSALKAVNVQSCKGKKGSPGEGHVLVTFMPTGAAASASVDRGPFTGTPIGTCIATEYKKAKIPPFKGTAAVTVGKIFKLD